VGGEELGKGCRVIWSDVLDAVFRARVKKQMDEQLGPLLILSRKNRLGLDFLDKRTSGIHLCLVPFCFCRFSVGVHSKPKDVLSGGAILANLFGKDGDDPRVVELT
jgi:hypothetical protein